MGGEGRGFAARSAVDKQVFVDGYGVVEFCVAFDVEIGSDNGEVAVDIDHAINPEAGINCCWLLCRL